MAKMHILATSVFPSLSNWKAFEHQINYTPPQEAKAALKNIVVPVSDQVEKSRNTAWESQKVLDSRLGKNSIPFARIPYNTLREQKCWILFISAGFMIQNED